MQNVYERVPSFLGKHSILVRELRGKQHFLARKRKVSQENNTFVREQRFRGNAVLLGKAKLLKENAKFLSKRKVKRVLSYENNITWGDWNTFGRTQ